MALDVAPTPPTATTTTVLHSSRGEKIGVAVIVLFLGLVIGAGAWITHFQPLQFAGFSGDDLLKASGAVAVNYQAPSAFGPQDNWVITTGRSTLWVETSFTNTAPVSVTITGFAAPFVGWAGFGAARGYVHDVNVGGLTDGRPFHAFRLAPNATRILNVAIPVTCRAQGGSEGATNSLVVDTSILGVSHQVSLTTSLFSIQYPSTC